MYIGFREQDEFTESHLSYWEDPKFLLDSGATVNLIDIETFIKILATLKVARIYLMIKWFMVILRRNLIRTYLKVLERYSENNLTLYREKFKFGKTELRFMGHININLRWCQTRYR